jgi:hypothetical protein
LWRKINLKWFDKVLFLGIMGQATLSDSEGKTSLYLVKKSVAGLDSP